MAEIAQENSPYLAELYSECIDLFAKFVLALSEPDCDVVSRDEVRLPQIFEEYGRTKIWGDQSKADLPAGARGSLDDILRRDNDLRLLVRGILQRLKVLLQQATHIAQRKYNPAQDIDQDSISSVSDSDCSTDNEDASQRRKMPKIRLFVQQIADQIRSLHDISSLLRRPTVTNKFIRSVNVEPKITTLQGLDDLHLDGAFELYDAKHILEKVLQWRGLGKSTQSINFYDEAVSPVNNAPNHQEIEYIQWFCQRLARANTRRREQLQYWKRHPYGPKQIVTNANVMRDLNITQGIVPLKRQEEDLRSQASTLKPLDPHVSHEGPKSVLSKQSFSTVALSDVHDTMTNTRPRTTYAPTAVGQDRAISVPEPPRTKYTEITFPCPYCGTILSSESTTKQLWKRHVFRDLRPYICTFEHCHNAEKLFSSRHEWKHHEFQVHRREYVCQRCWNRCTSREDMSIHLQDHYEDPIPSAQMNIILDLCDRQADAFDHNTESCILCGEEVSLSAWHDHVAGHMENISLFVLPTPEDDKEETEGSTISGKADILDSSNDSTGSLSMASSLGFSAAGDYGQTSAEFAKMLACEEVEYTSKLATWKATDEDDLSMLNTEGQLAIGSDPLIEEFEELKKTSERNIENPKWKDSLTRMSELITQLIKRTATTDVNMRKHSEASLVRMGIDVVRLSREKLGETHPFTLTSIANLAEMYKNQGLLQEAESQWLELIDTKKAVLGPEHPDTLKSVADLVWTYQNQDRWKEAESLQLELTDTKKAVLGPEHPDTLKNVANLAWIYQNQGRWQEAESLQVKLIETRRTVLGPEHPDTLTSMGNLTWTYQSQGLWDLAESWYTWAFQGFEEMLESDHQPTLQGFGKMIGTDQQPILHRTEKLGRFYEKQGRLQDAEAIYKGPLEDFEKVLKSDHQSTVHIVERLGRLYERQSRLQDAETMYEQALQGSEKVLGSDHQCTIHLVEKVGCLYESQDRFQDAEAMYERVLQDQEKRWGPDGVTTLRMVEKLGCLYESQGRLQDAVAMYERALQGYEKTWGPDDVTTLRMVEKLGCLYESQGRLQDAEAMYERVR
ncbi:hypothetical protein F5Y19DRAFT_422956 [Xylariaceae sp. FL1651]|nr:hypothetical protein F5Y19DRAFT_422956 [Xylariaceae sp. FL1651]